MPTPVNAARQCLMEEAAKALDEAVAVARLRGHAQTTSLHLVPALLSLPSSALREACGRARNNAYSTRVQFKALELSLSSSLDRMPSSPQQRRVEEPPVSNSLMAAIKRSQANQRRQPENFTFYNHHQQQQQQQSSGSSSISIVKVELQSLMVSILDDPIVSRVFAEAGFRSYDIKLASLRPVHQILRYSKYRGPPMFLCSLDNDLDLACRAFTFPFLGFPNFRQSDENCRRIGEILVRKRGRNPLLVGFCAGEALRSFVEMVQGRRGGALLPQEVSGLTIASVENEVLRFATGKCDEGQVRVKFQEVSRMVRNSVGGGVVVNFGELRVMSDPGASVEAVGFVVRELTMLLEIHAGKMWLIGAASRYETYMKFLGTFPSIDKNWDLQFLPITSHEPPTTKDSYPRSSLMENFVPLGGFFSTPSSLKIPLSCSRSYVTGCHLGNDKHKQESNGFSAGNLNASIPGCHESRSPSWLQRVEHNMNNGFGVLKAKDDKMVLTMKPVGLQRKPDKYYQHIRGTQPSLDGDSLTKVPNCPNGLDFQPTEDGTENADNYQSEKADASSMESRCDTKNFLLELPSRNEHELGDFKTPQSLSSSNGGESRTSPVSAASVTTDLGLGVSSAALNEELVKSPNRTRTDYKQSFSHQLDVVTRSNSDYSTQSSSSSPFHTRKDYKTLYMALSETVRHQESAIRVISQRLTHRRERTERHRQRADIWFHFLGPDKLGKKKIGLALAKILYGTTDNFIFVDISLYNGTTEADSTRHSEDVCCYNVIKFRGRTVVDYITEELSKRPPSVVFLENIDEADSLCQITLSRALKTGRFSDPFGREVSINNTLFVTSSASSSVEYSLPKASQIQISVGFDLGDDINQNPCLMNKRKLIGSAESPKREGKSETAKRRANGASSNISLDLNLPAEKTDNNDKTKSDIIDDISNSSNSSNTWLEHFLGEVDETVVFRRFDFDELAGRLSKDIRGCLREVIGLECLLEIENNVMEQIVAAAYYLENGRVEDWISRVLIRGFVEARARYNLSARSVLTLSNCEGLSPEDDQHPYVFLPSRVTVN